MFEAGDNVRVIPGSSCDMVEGVGFVLNVDNGEVWVLFGQLDSGELRYYDESQLEKING